MILPILAVLSGLILLVWSADRFVDGSAATAKYFGMSPLFIGMVVVGFGTSAPEMVVSALAAIQGNLGIAMGNAYGSNIANIGLILGVCAMVSPIMVHSTVLKKELPLLTGVTLLSGALIVDSTLSRFDAMILLLIFVVLMFWSFWTSQKSHSDALGKEVEQSMEPKPTSIRGPILWILAGLALLIASSRLLVWGAVEIAHYFGVSDLIVGLTVVAIGTSLPEFASSLMAAKKGEHDIALGNIIGSNLFNTLAVVGIAASISPFSVDPQILHRDILFMLGFTLVLFAFGFGFRKRQGRINRFEGLLLTTGYVLYTLLLVRFSLS